MFLPLGLKVLVHQNEGRQEDELDADDESEERERVGVECCDAGHYSEVRHDPGGEEDGVSGDEPQAAEVPGDSVPDLLHPRAATVELLLQVGDGLDVLLGGLGQ